MVTMPQLSAWVTEAHAIEWAFIGDGSRALFTGAAPDRPLRFTTPAIYAIGGNSDTV